MSKSDKMLSSILEDNVADITLENHQNILTKFQSLFFSNHEINFADQLEDIVRQTLDDEEIATRIKGIWVERLLNKHGDQVYFEFMPQGVPSFKKVWSDADNRITLKYDPDIEPAINVNQKDDEYIVIKIKRVYIKEINKNED